MCTFAFLHLIALSGNKVDLIQGVKRHVIVETFKISNSCSKINLCVMSNNAVGSLKLVFQYATKFSMELGPRRLTHPPFTSTLPDQYTGPPVEYTRTQDSISAKILEDFVDVSTVGDLHVEENQPCPCKLAFNTLHQFPRYAPERSHTPLCKSVLVLLRQGLFSAGFPSVR